MDCGVESSGSGVPAEVGKAVLTLDSIHNIQELKRGRCVCLGASSTHMGLCVVIVLGLQCFPLKRACVLSILNTCCTWG